MTSNTEKAEIEQGSNRRRATMSARAYARPFGAITLRFRPRLTINQLLLNAFGAISPAYLF